ncbi:MAG: SAM-dependent methyltransferase [Carbonactinosporaceae bacterium]
MTRSQRDWYAWHTPYDDDASPLARRLRLVQAHIRTWLDSRPGEPVAVVSACAGQGRDLVGVLAGRSDADRVRAWLLEGDERNAAAAEAATQAAGLAQVVVRRADAGAVDAYLGAVPADLVLMCGVFGSIGDTDVRRTVGGLRQLCAPGATVVWTRSRRPPDLTPDIRRWFDGCGFAEVTFDAPADALHSVGVHRLVAEPQAPVPGRVLFRFLT